MTIRSEIARALQVANRPKESYLSADQREESESASFGAYLKLADAIMPFIPNRKEIAARALREVSKWMCDPTRPDNEPFMFDRRQRDFLVERAEQIDPFEKGLPPTTSLAGAASMLLVSRDRLEELLSIGAIGFAVVDDERRIPADELSNFVQRRAAGTAYAAAHPDTGPVSI